MAESNWAPFRADHVGSLLRPPELAEARARLARGEITADQLRPIQEKCIREVVARQETLGLQAVTDGEFSRDWWHVDFLTGLEGVDAIFEKAPMAFQNSEEQPPVLHVTGRVRRKKPVFVDHFAYLKSVSKSVPKLTIPAPGMLHLRGGRSAVSDEAYPDIDEMWEDVAAAYSEEIAELGAAGCRYLQMDDVSFAYLCDAKFRETAIARGDDPDELLRTYVQALNRSIADRPPGMRITTHTCRGNFRSTWVAQGGYEPVAEILFNDLQVDGYFLEFDSERAGGFEPLRFMPKGKMVVLGLVTSKSPKLEDRGQLRRRIDEAAKYVPLENLCLSPQCGFSSTHHGNSLTPEQQWKKLELVVDVARSVWG